MLKAGVKLKDIPLPPIEIEENKKVIIYGTGDVAERYFDKIIEKYGEEKFAFFIEGQSADKFFLNKTVIKPEELKAEDIHKYVYLLGSFGSVTLMKERLKKLGIKDKQILPSMDRCNIEMLYQYEKRIKNIAIYPPMKEKNEEDEIIKIINLYLIPRKDLEGKIFLFSNKAKYINDNIIVVNKNIKQVNYNEYDVILVWNPKELYNEEILNHKCVYCFHPEVIPHLDSKILNCISMKILKKEEKENYIQYSKINFKNLIVGNEKKRRAYVFGSGPSLTRFMKKENLHILEDGIRIVCNEFCENEEIMHLIKPQIYVLWDYGYFEEKLNKIMIKISNYINQNDCILIVPDTAVRVLHINYGIKLESIIGINPYGRKLNFPTPENLEIIRTDNVMTAMAVPIASTLADKVYMLGCDGMKDDGEWNHSKLLKGDSTEYCETEAERMGKCKLLNKYKGICEYYEKLFSYGELQGKHYEALTETAVPALRRRSKGVENEL